MDDLTTTWPLLLERGVHLPVGWLTRGGWRLVEDEPDTGQVWWMDDGGVHRGPLPTSWASSAPDLTDPATLGCLLAEVRRLSGDDSAYCARERAAYAKPWRVWLPGDPVGYGATEGEALLAALLYITTPKATP